MPDPRRARLTVQRVGGLLPTLRPSRTWELAELDEETRAAVLAFMRAAPPVKSARHPDAMSYVFELDAEGRRLTTTAAYAAIPEALRPLLPGPK